MVPIPRRIRPVRRRTWLRWRRGRNARSPGAGGGPRPPLLRIPESGDLVYLAGALGNVPGTLDLVPGGIEAQVRQTMDNLGATLESAGLDFSRVAASQRLSLGRPALPGDERGVPRVLPGGPPDAGHRRGGHRDPGGARRDLDGGGEGRGRARGDQPRGDEEPGASLFLGDPGGRYALRRRRHRPRPGHLPAGRRGRHRADGAHHGEHRARPRSGGNGLRGRRQLPGVPR